MSLSEHEFQKIAALAYLETNPSHTHQLAHDVEAILSFVKILRQIDTTNVVPLFHPLDLHQRLRQDEIVENNQVNPLAKIAPLFSDDLYLVPKVIDSGK